MEEKEIAFGRGNEVTPPLLVCFLLYSYHMQKYKIHRQLNTEERNKLSEHNDIISHILFHRGIKDNESARIFKNPDYGRDMHDPFLFKDMEKSTNRIIHAIKNNEKIAVYTDYDADGIPAAVIFKDFFKRINYENFIIYIPHRHNEGFGLNEEAVSTIGKQGVKLIITADCGISDKEAVDKANELGMEVIITDHHESPKVLPKAYAIVDHKQVDCDYPDKNLCGSGVVFKLIQGILAKERFGMKEGQEKWLLDMVGIATLSDMVPLLGENRVFASYGLMVLRKSPRKGLLSLFSKLNISQKNLSEDDVSFMITPRINAASRMGAPMDAFNLLSAENEDEAHEYLEKLEHINNERKGVVASLVKEVKKIIHDRYGKDKTSLPYAIVLGNPEWRPSLLGLVANSCAEEFNRPVFLWGRDGDNTIKGSCRSEGTTNIVEVMKESHLDTFVQYGGHKHSGGFVVSNEDVFHLEQRINDACCKVNENKEVSDDNFDMIDAILSLKNINNDFINDIMSLSPFGIGNPKPLFIFQNIIPIQVRRFGKTNNHLEFVFDKGNGQKISAISFFGMENSRLCNIKENEKINLVASIEKSFYRNKVELRLRVEDICDNI